MRSALNGYWSIMLKEIVHIRRDPATLFFALFIPLGQLLLYGYAVDYDVRHVQTAIVDMDRSRESREYVASLQNTGYLDVVSNLQTPDDAESALRKGEARVAIIIPPDFARRYGTKNPPQVRVLLDGSDSQVATPARNAVRSLGLIASTSAVDTRVNVLFNPQIRTQIYTIPGLVGIILQMVTVSLTSFSMVREREQGTLEQLMVSPVGRVGLMLGKLTPYSFLAMAELFAILILGRLIFDIRITGNPVLLVVLAVPFVLAALSMGLLISTIAQNQAQALQMTLLTVLPSVLLTGYIAPRETLPASLYLLSNCLPATYFIQIMRAVVVRGAGLQDVLPNVYALMIITVVLLTLATTRFRKSVG